MTTSIITNLIEPMCELFYKYKKGLEIARANVNTLRNYGFSTDYALNFGFSVYEPFKMDDIKLQPGVFTTSSTYYLQPDLNNAQSFSAINQIVFSDLPQSGIGTLNYRNKTLPVSISIQQNVSTVVGIASDYLTNGIPYDKNENLDTQVLRSFESDYADDSTLTALIFVDFEDVSITGINTDWSIAPTSLYSYRQENFRYNNGYGQFFSGLANNSFIRTAVNLPSLEFTNLYNCTYMNVYNWINNLTWEPDFITWYNANPNLVPRFTAQFINEYFNI